jgi:hypothetical protein
MTRALPELTDFQLDCLRQFLRFALPIEAFHEPLKPLISFKLDGPSTLQEVHYSAGIPKNPIRVTREEIDGAIAKVKRGEITTRQLQ